MYDNDIYLHYCMSTESSKVGALSTVATTNITQSLVNAPSSPINKHLTASINNRDSHDVYFNCVSDP